MTAKTLNIILSWIKIYQKGAEQENDSHFLSPHQENTPVQVTPLRPHFYIVKLGFTGVYFIFLFCSKI